VGVFVGSRWTVKPPPGVDLDRTHPLCPDHCWPFLSPQGSPQCLARHRPVPRVASDIYTGSKSWRPGGKYGLSLRHAAVTDRSLLVNAVAADIDAVFPANAGTLLIAFRPTSVVGNSTIGIDTGVANQAVYLLLPWTDNLVYANYGTVQLSGTTTGLTFGDDIWTMTAGPRGVELWQNTRLHASVATVPTRSLGANVPLYYNSWTQSKSPLGDTALIMTWRRQLSGAAVRDLAVNPWQVFQPRTFVVVRPPATPPTAGLSAVPLVGSRWTVKPPPGVDLDRTHPLCPDHAWPFLSPQGTAQPLTKGAPLLAPSTRGDIYAGSSTIVRGRKYGLSVRHAGTSDTMRLTADLAAEVDKVVPNSGGHTVLLAYRKLDTTLRNCSVFGNNTSTGNEWYGVHGLPWQDGSVVWRFGQQTEGVGQLSITAAALTALGVTFGDDIWAFTSGPRGMEIYWNGRLLASNTGNSTRTSAAAKPLLFPSFAPINSDLADIGLFMTWRRQLPEAAVRALSINPWQVFQPTVSVNLRQALPAAPGIGRSIVPLVAARWTVKPPPGTDLDRAHPLCPDHAWPILSPQGTAQALARHAPIKRPATGGDIYAGSSSIVAGGKYGLAVRHAATTDVMRCTTDDALEIDKIVGKSGGFTLLIAHRKRDQTLRQAAVWGDNGTLNDSGNINFFAPFSDGVIYFRYGNPNTEGVNQLSLNGTAAGLVYGDDLWCCTTGPRGMEIWRNGILLASNTANPTRTTQTFSTARLAFPAATPNWSDMSDVAFVMTWRRQLAAAAVRALSINPWQVFQPATVLVTPLIVPAAAVIVVPVVTFPALVLAP